MPFKGAPAWEIYRSWVSWLDVRSLDSQGPSAAFLPAWHDAALFHHCVIPIWHG